MNKWGLYHAYRYIQKYYHTIYQVIETTQGSIKLAAARVQTACNNDYYNIKDLLSQKEPTAQNPKTDWTASSLLSPCLVNILWGTSDSSLDLDSEIKKCMLEGFIDLSSYSSAPTI